MNKKFLYSPLSIKSIGENGVFSGYARLCGQNFREAIQELQQN